MQMEAAYMFDDLADEEAHDSVSRAEERGYVNRCVNDIRRRPSQPLIQWRFHPHTVHRDRRLSINSGAFRRLKRCSATINIFQITAIARSTLL